MKFSPEKYTYYVHETKSGAKEVIAVSTYAGKIVRGTAKCDPKDAFDEVKGKELAAARCNVRVTAKRKARATQKFREAEATLKAAQQNYWKMLNYYMDSNNEYNAAVAEVKTIVENL